MTWLVYLLIGIILGIIIGVFIDRDTVNKYLIRKVKLKGDNSTITIDQLKEKLKEEKRKIRRSKRLSKKVEG